MGRPRTNPGPPARRGRPPVPTPRRSTSFKLTAKDLADLDAIATEVAARERSTPNRTRALRWAVRELFARLHGSTPIGPVTTPPDF